MSCLLVGGITANHKQQTTPIQSNFKLAEKHHQIESSRIIFHSIIPQLFQYYSSIIPQFITITRHDYFINFHQVSLR